VRLRRRVQEPPYAALHATRGFFRAILVPSILRHGGSSSMKRRVTKRPRGPRAYDIRTELSKEQLAALGAVTLAWNDVEAMIDVLLCVASGIHHKMWREFTTRINGIDGKFAIMKAAITDRYGFLNDSEMLMEFFSTLAVAAQYKKYRDTIIHSRIIDAVQGIGEMTFRRDRLEEVLLTADALNGLYDKLFVLRAELMALISFFEIVEDLRARLPDGTLISRLATQNFNARLAAMAEGKYGAIGNDPPNEEAIVQELATAMSRYHSHQRQRKSLPPLPSFPALPPIHLGLGAFQPVPLNDPPEPPQEPKTDEPS